ncbi:MAG: alpha/beta fold hydrolase [bacterium]|nr:alpha/beta fold hydrolase [bacterium]
MEKVIVPALDGYRLGATLFPAPSHDTVVVVHGATAVPHRFYADIATFFQRSGWTTLTYDYRGIGASRPEKLRGFGARVSDWAMNDLPGVLRWAHEELRPRRLFSIGHSFGGQVTGLLERPDQIDAMVTLSAQSGYWGVQPGGERLRVWFFVTLLLPTLSRVLGYFPWSTIGKGEDLPAGVALDWSRWCRSRRYVLDDPSLPVERYANFGAPILAYSVEDDGWGSSRSVDEMMSAYPNVQRQHLVPSEHELKSLGHAGYFRSRAAALWPVARNWLDRAAPLPVD